MVAVPCEAGGVAPGGNANFVESRVVGCVSSSDLLFFQKFLEKSWGGTRDTTISEPDFAVSLVAPGLFEPDFAELVEQYNELVP